MRSRESFAACVSRTGTLQLLGMGTLGVIGWTGRRQWRTA